jgi:hypothetical protein
MGVTLADRSDQAWAEAALALQAGEAVAEACARAGLHRALIARLSAAAGGAWVELLDGIDDARVLVVEHAPGLATVRIAARAAVVGCAEANDARAHFRRALLQGQPARLVIDTERRLAAGKDGWYLVIVDGLLGTRDGRGLPLDARLRELVAGLAPGGRLVVVADNRLSPLRAVDRAVGRPAGPPGPSLQAVERSLQRAGLAVVQRFGLLRSSLDGVTAVDVDAPRATEAILSASAVRTGRSRTAGLELLAKVARRGSVAPLLPAWMVVAAQPGAWTADDRRPTGRLGYKESRESKVLRGEPPLEVEKRYSNVDDRRREAMALRTLEACGEWRAPRLVAELPGRIRQTWLPGRPLRPAALRSSEIRFWVDRAARVLGEIQRATTRDDGQVLVHGDYWLGNLLVEGNQVVGVLDWSGAHWGDPEEDTMHLSDSLVTAGLASRRQATSVAEVASAACRQARLA